MDYPEATAIVFRRVAELKPQNAAKVLGYILLQDQGISEMVRLANAPTQFLKILIDEIEEKLFPSPQNLQHLPLASSSSQPVEHSLHNQPHETNPIHPSNSCPNFNRGYCRHGGNCKFLHILQLEDGTYVVINRPDRDDTMIPDRALQPGSLKHFEMELIDLLRSRRGIPFSISSIPILYYDKYATSLPVEAYLLEDCKKEEFVCTMKKLLAQMEKTICILNRPHRRPSIVLVEDFKKCNDVGYGHGLELRVYMTFRPQSTFTEQDAHNYFENFGPVQEVKIPYQVERMYGFVTFVYPETAALVLTKTNPHIILGSQVKVKPYQSNPMLVNSTRP